MKAVQPSLFTQPAAPGASVKNCTLIYPPRGRAGEYADLACNVYRGCDHLCTYCFGPSATRRSRSDFAASSTRGPKFLQRLEKEARKYQAAGIVDRVLLSFTCDPYQHLDVSAQVTRQVIRLLHVHGLNVQILTKGGSRALRDLDLLRPEDAFATTLTFLDDERSLSWEPRAALPGDRIATIQEFHSCGIPTWVSLEPVIDPEAALEIIRQTHPFVDLYKVGKLNYHRLRVQPDWGRFAQDAIDLLESLGKPYYIKNDLRAYLDKTAR